MRNNFVTVNNSGIRTDGGGMGSLITLNEVARPTSGHTNTFDGILLVGKVSSIQVTANLARDQEGGGIEVGHGGGAAATNITVSNNTVRGNGFVNVGGGAASSEPIGIDAYAAAGSGLVFSRNLVTGNAGPGILVTSSTGVTISQNSFSSNGGLSIDLDPRGLDPNTMGAPQGVTLNDNGDGDAGPNGLRNYPVIASAVLVAGELTFAWIRAAWQRHGVVHRAGRSFRLRRRAHLPRHFCRRLARGSRCRRQAPMVLPLSMASHRARTTPIASVSRSRLRRRGRGHGVELARPPLAARPRSSAATWWSRPGPNLQVVKLVQPLTDPVNNATNPKSIPGSVQRYTVRVTNQGTGPVDNNSVLIVDKIPTNTKMFVGNLGCAGIGSRGIHERHAEQCADVDFHGAEQLGRRPGFFE